MNEPTNTEIIRMGQALLADASNDDAFEAEMRGMLKELSDAINLALSVGVPADDLQIVRQTHAETLALMMVHREWRIN
jgi:hypothetical protein